MTTNSARARRILESMTNPATARAAAQALEDAGLLAPEPQIIRTRKKLATHGRERYRITKFHRDDDVLTMIAKLAYKSDRDGKLDKRIVARVEGAHAARQAREAADSTANTRWEELA